MTTSDVSNQNFGPTTTVAEVGEHKLISLIGEQLACEASSIEQERVFDKPGGVEVEVDSGDDAAVLNLGSDRVVVSTDVLVEERHFRVRWSSGVDVGVKVAAANLADIAAMGASPVALVVALVVPGTTPLNWVLDLARGLAREATRAGAVVVGGDISGGEAISVAATAIGRLETGARAVRLDGAQVGDQVAIVGRLGWSEAGLTILSRGFSSPKVIVEAHRRPNPDYAAALLAAKYAHAMTDISDGLVADLAHIARASNVAVEIDYGSLPQDDDLLQASAALNVDLSGWLLGGGEDHGFLATFPPNVQLPVGFTKIGTAVPRTEGTAIVSVLGPDGEPMDLRPFRGYVHY